ncbi:efflux transporter periplasmic adaptor subunit [Photobacterium rosenbergii]|uniref:Efflux transporter periplasmic adaptor subunit n=1 Tax=Photobacterium rosenbergii TaxID=294936 RepID=A0A2T3NHW4_9GAMM|nr:HlyD family secretion protein [Photobacterium rosenbergii]PSW14617.1 efflux transporter periplasmic adaptor subunit [Photobacterium rosenbergii]
MFKKLLFTIPLVALAGSIVINKIEQTEQSPWTRDAQVRAHIIQITPRVTGPIINLAVNDDSEVKKGDLLFEIDPSIYKADLEKAIAQQQQANEQLKKAKNEESRSVALSRRQPGSVPVLNLNNLHIAVTTAQANLAAANAVVNEAKLNLAFTKVTAPADGFITNLNLREGTQVVANQPTVALIDKHSFWVEGFFKETDLKDVNQGDKGMITLMMHPDKPFEGNISSIGYGISQQDGSTGNSLLPNVNPNFEWIRLAQRIPVKFHFELPENGIQLRVGTTASVKIIKQESN